MKNVFKFISLLLLLWLITITTDYILYKNNKNPFFAINTSIYKDGGSKDYFGLGYKVIRCNTLTGDKNIHFGFYNINVNNFCINSRSDEHSFKGTIVTVEKENLLIKPNDDQKENLSSDLFSITKDKDIFYEVGMEVIITYQGEIMESYPAMINVINIKIIN